jgi:hypothetical protein
MNAEASGACAARPAGPPARAGWRAAPATLCFVAANLAAFAFERALLLLSPGVGTEAWLWNTPPLVTGRFFDCDSVVASPWGDLLGLPSV